MDISPIYQVRSWHWGAARLFKLGLGALVLVGATCSWSAGVPDDYVIRGKNDWLFVRHEILHEALDPAARVSLGLIEKLNRVLARNQIALLVAVVPSKIETHAEQLPDDFKVSRYMQGFYDSMLATLRTAGVAAVDLKKPLRNAALQNADSPVYFRLDTHWAPSGAMAAAQAIQEGISTSPSLKKALDSVPSVKYKLEWASKKQRTRFRDITTYLPPGSPSYPPDEIFRFQVSKDNAARVSLLGDMGGGDIALAGSSLSGDSTGFADALRYTLQRDIVNFSINADVGPWVVMRSYLLSDAFQIKPPKLVIWEIPERVIALGPNYQFRPERYKIEDSDWLLQVGALGQRVCESSGVKPKIEPSGLQVGPGTRANTSTTDADFVEVSFDKPADPLAYLSARIVADGSRQILIESHGPTGLVKKFTVDAAGDELAHTLRAPLDFRAKGVNRIKIYPGITKTFALTDVEVCRYPEDLLK